MRVNPPMLEALLLSTDVTLQLRRHETCSKRCGSCWSVLLAVRVDDPGHSLRRVEGPYEHLSIEAALDVAAVVSAHYGSALELRRAMQARESWTTLFDPDELS